MDGRWSGKVFRCVVPSVLAACIGFVAVGSAVASDYVAVSASKLHHSLGVKSDGTVWAWGLNDVGQLGDGSITNSNVPVQVVESSGGSPFTGVVAISGGRKHSLALKSDGTVWAWGLNDVGQLGDGSNTNSGYPVQVSGLSGAIAIAAGGYHSLALKSDGTVWAWGLNDVGQLGDGSITNNNVPVQVSALADVMGVSGGYAHSLALKSDGTVWAWGLNDVGQLGNGSIMDSNVPVQVVESSGGSPFTEAVAVSAGSIYSFAVKSDGTVWAWGDNYKGQLGDGTSMNSNVPVQVVESSGGSPFTGAVAASAGDGHSLSVKSDGTVWEWGAAGGGMVPRQVSALADIVSVSGAYAHSLAVKSDGTVWAWGLNDVGQLGDGSNTNRDVPVQSDFSLKGAPPGAVAIAGGDMHSLALRSNGTVWAWGLNDVGQLGDGSNTNRRYPDQVYGLAGVVAIAGGDMHSLALRSDGTVWAWGYNYDGELGNGNNTDSNVPVQVVEYAGGPPLTGVVAVAAGGAHSLALKSDGTVWAWGLNSVGQLGNGSMSGSNVPVQVVESSGGSPFTKVVAVAAGLSHSLALKSDGTVWAWGDNGKNQLGTGNTSYIWTVPVQVVDSSGGSPFTKVVAIAGGDMHSLASRSDGTVWSWGENDDGQLGHGGLNGEWDYRRAVWYAAEVVAIAGGGKHSLASRSDGTVWAWGDNDFGQLGNGSITDSNVPVQVLEFSGGSPFTGVVNIAAGKRQSLALRSDGTVWAWGLNDVGQLGTGEPGGQYNYPRQVLLGNPVARKDAYDVSENSGLSLGVLDNDTDPDGRFLAVVLVSGPAHGTVTRPSTDYFFYQPDGVYVGQDTFTYKAFNGFLYSNITTVTLTIIPENDPPVAVDDSYTSPMSSPLRVAAPGVLSNDTDEEGDALWIYNYGHPIYGSLTELNADGSFTYTPNAGFTGTDSFKYRAWDGKLFSVKEATVTIIVENHPPVAADDSYSFAGYSASISYSSGVLGNDTDPDGNPLTAVLVTGPANGSLTLNPNGSFSYTSNISSPGATDSFTYRASDGNLQSNIATVTLTVGLSLNRPVAAPDVYTTPPGVALTIPAPGVLSNDTDADGNTLTASIFAQPVNGAVALSANGSFTYYPNPGFVGTDSFKYRAYDGWTFSFPVGTVTITVTPPNNPPTASPNSVTTAEDTPLNITLSGTDPDGDSLTYSVVSVPAHGTLSGTAPTLTYQPSLNYNGSDSFTFKVNDGKVDSGPATVSITVTPVNDAPVANNDAYRTSEDTPLTVVKPGVLSNDTDPEGDPLTALLVTGPANGTLTLNLDGSFFYEPKPNFFGTDSFTYQASDHQYVSNVATVTIRIEPVPDAPVAANDVYSTNEDTRLTVAAPGVLGNDTDADGDILYAILDTKPRNGTLTLNQDGSFTYDPNPNFFGTDGFTYQVTDGSTTSSRPGEVRITVTLVNDPPVANDQYPTTAEDTPANITLTGTDPDGDSLTYMVVSGPTHGTLTGTAPDFVYTPFLNFYGPDSFTFKVNDGTVDSGVGTVHITVTPTPDAPVANGDAYSTNEDTALTVSAPGVLSNDTDPDNGTMTAVLAADPAHGTATLNPDGSFTYNPDAEFFGTDSFTYRVSAGPRQSGIAVVTITVVPDSPGDTPPGGDVSVNPVDPTTDGTPATITFGDVTGSGTTTVTTSPNGQPPPTGFRMGNPPTYYEISTTATYAGSVQICITYAEGDYKNEKNLRLMHNTDTNGDGVGDTWVDITVAGYPDTVNNKVCGTTTSLSPFAVIEPTITAPVAPVAITAPVQVGFRFQSIGTGTWSAAWNWGDGDSSDATVSCNSTTGLCEVTGDHVYGAPGVYTVGLSISLDGVPHGSDEYKYVVVYDPNGSFVTGGGWIQSPPGAYAADPELTGKASFGFVSKYKKGATIPSGNTQFQFNAAGMDFVSTSYQWLVISGARAQFKGLGSINGEGAYGFLLTAIDGNVAGGGGSDKFRIKIWDPAASDAIVYDNQLGAMDDATPVTTLGGGSIVIHKQ